MREYFKLQYKMINSMFKDAGLEPFVAYIVLAILFAAFSVYIFSKTEYAGYVYILSALALTGWLSETRRNEFLKICFNKNKYRLLRMTENLLVVVPFVMFLIYKHHFLQAIALPLISMLLSLGNFSTVINVAIPTPFYAKPFEFSVGFRNTFYLIFAAYIISIIAIAVANFNLGVFAMVLVFAVTLTYYAKPENDYFIWSYKLSARRFLFEKIKVAILYSGLLVSPVVLMLGIFFPYNIHILLIAVSAGGAFLICMIVSKYAAYPDEMNIAQGILLAMCIGFPPLLIAMIPFLFLKSENRLSQLLE